MLRTYNNLSELFVKETKLTSPRSDARKLEAQMSSDHPEYTALVLFRAGDGSWTVQPVDPQERLRNIPQASRTILGGKKAVAYCFRVRILGAQAAPSAAAPAPSYQ